MMVVLSEKLRPSRGDFSLSLLFPPLFFFLPHIGFKFVRSGRERGNEGSGREAAPPLLFFSLPLFSRGAPCHQDGRTVIQRL